MASWTVSRSVRSSSWERPLMTSMVIRGIACRPASGVVSWS
jgi:hypothetical protein